MNRVCLNCLIVEQFDYTLMYTYECLFESVSYESVSQLHKVSVLTCDLINSFIY